LESLKVLYAHYSLPDEKSLATLNVENIIKEFKKHIEIQTSCLIYRPEKLESEQNKIENTTILDIHNYKNAMELIKKEKPDLIFAGGLSTALVDNAITLAGKFLGIPLISLMNIPFSRKRSKKEISSFISMFFERSLPTDRSDENKKFFRRGKFFISRYLFFLRTQKKVGISNWTILKYFFHFLKQILSFNYLPFSSEFEGTLHFLAGEKYLKSLIRLGFKKESIVVTGLPAYDPIFKKLQNFEKPSKIYSKIRVMFVPDTLYEHGIWSKNQRDNTIKSIVKNLSKHKKKISLIIKIHPSYANLSEYQSIIKPIDPSIPIYQKEDFLQLLEKSDIIIDFASFSTSIVFALIANKPIILCSPFQFSDDEFLKKGLAVGCKDPTKLPDLIPQMLAPNLALEQKRDEFIREYLYKADGQASERIYYHILKLLKKSHGVK